MKKLLFLVLFCLLSIVFRGEATDDGGRRIIVRGDQNFAPFEYLDENGSPAGFDIDILRAVAEVMGLNVELSLGPWEEVRQQLENGQIDALAGMRHSEERELLVDFSAPYLINTSAIFIRADSRIQTLEDLSGKEIIVQRGDIMDDLVRNMNLSANIVFVGNQTEALELLASGKHDAAFCSRLRGLYLIRRLKLDNLTVVGPELTGGPYGFAVAQGNHTLLAKFNEGLRILKSTGRYDEIYERWFGLYEKESLFKSLMRYAFWVLTPILLLLAGAVAWTWALRRQVASKTRELEEQLAERQRAEARLESERKFRQVVEASPVPMAIIGAGQRILYVNHKFTKLFGYTLEELPDTQAWWSRACPDIAQRRVIQETWNARLGATGPLAHASETFEVEITCRDGSVRHVICRHSTIDERHFVVFNDITKRKMAENALEYRVRVEAMISAISTRFVNLPATAMDREIERALQEIGEGIGVDRSYVFQFAADGSSMSNTHEWCAGGIEPHKKRLQNIPAERFSWYLKQLTDEGVFYCPSVAALGPEAQAEKEEWQRENIQSLITVPMLLKGQRVGFLGFDSVRSERSWPEEILFLLKIVGESFANALERARVEEALRFAHQQLQDIIDFLPDATFVIDEKGEVVAWNRAIAEMTGVPKEEMLGKGDYAYAVPFYGERRPTLLDLIQHPAPERPVDCTVLQEDGRALFAEQFLPGLYGGKGAHVWAKASPLCDREGNLVGAIESIRDISTRKEAQEKLEASTREMEAFAYTVSHDLRIPLTPIIGYADFLRDNYRGRLDAQALGCLAEISASGNKMLKLMEDLLDLAKVGHLGAPREPVDGNKVVEEVVENLGPLIAATGARIQATPLPPLRLQATLLSQIFGNLIGNAVRYAGKEGSPIEIGGERDGDTLRLFVRDHGPGIPAAERERIFEVFYRGQEGKDTEGTGIGLATVQKIARLYGGTARVEETPGGGATFCVEMKDAAAAPEQPPGDGHDSKRPEYPS